MLRARFLAAAAAVLAAFFAPAFAAAPTTSPQWVDITQAPYSADPTDTSDSTTGIKAAISAAITGGQPLYLPRGTYKVSSKLTIDFAGLAATGFRVISDGATIDGTPIAAGPVLQVQCGGGTPGSPTNCNEFKEQGTLYINAAGSGYAFIFGTTNFADLQQFPRIDQVVVANTGAGGGGCQLNNIVAGQIGLACSATGSGALAGLALEQTQTSSLSGPFSSTGGVALLLENGSSLRNSFTGLQLAQSATCISITSSTAASNTWLSPLLNCTTVANATGGSQNELINPQYGPSVVNLAPISFGLRVVGGSSRGQWIFPSASTYTATALDDGIGVGSGSAGGTLTTTLPSIASTGLNSGWSMGFASTTSNAHIVQVPSGDAARILAGGKSLTSVTLPAGAFEYLKLESNAGNWVVVAATRATKLGAGMEAGGFPGGQWIFPSATGYNAAIADNGNTLSPLNSGANLTVTLPSTTGLPTGWSIGLATDAGLGIIAQVNATSGSKIVYGGAGCSGGCSGVSSITVPGGMNSNYELVTLQYDGSVFRVSSATPGAAQALGMTGASAYVIGNTALANLPPAVHNARRIGFYTFGDSPPQDFSLSPVSTPCTLNSGAGDGFIQVASAISGRCWNIVAPDDGGLSVKDAGASGSATVAQCTTTANVATVTLDHVWDFQNNQPITCVGAGAPAGVGTPPTPTLSVIGPTGTSTYCMRIAYIGVHMQIGPASGEICAFNGNAVLDTVPDLAAMEQGIRVTWGATASNVLGIVIYEGPSGGEQFVGIGAPAMTIQPSCTYFVGGVCPASGTWAFYGVNVQNRPSWVPASPLTSAQSQALTTTIQSGAGTTALVVSPAPGTTVVSQPAWHDDTAAFQTALADYQHLKMGPGTYNITGTLGSTLDGQRLIGCGRDCAIISPRGPFDLFSLTNPNYSPFVSGSGNEGQGAEHFSIAGLDHIGWAFRTDSARSRVEDIFLNQPWETAYVGGSNPANAVVFQNIWEVVEQRGPFGVMLDGTQTSVNCGGGVSSGACAVIQPWLDKVSLQVMYNGIGLWVEGDVASTQAIHFTTYQGPYPGVAMDNNSLSAAGPKLNKFNDYAANVCWHLCVLMTSAGVGPQGTQANTIADPFIQTHNGGQSSAIEIGPNVSHTIIHGGQIFGSSTDNTELGGADIAGVDDFGFSTVIDGSTIYAFADEAIACESGANTQVIGGADPHFLSQIAYPSGSYGVLLKPGCSGAHIAGLWLGQVGDVVDQSGTPNNNYIEGRPPGSLDTEVTVTGGMTLTASGYPNVYSNSLPGIGIVFMQPGGAVHLDTAANIAGAMGADNSRIMVIFKNMKSPAAVGNIVLSPAANDSANLNLNHNTTVTIAPGQQVACSFAKTTSPLLTVFCSL